jgi:PadR family transcriptional regulator PadR
VASAEEWPSDWLRATLGLCVLWALRPGPSYGYAIITDLAKAGFGEIKGGTLYPLLARFEAAGLVETEWRPGEGGPGRKYFALTGTGRSEVERLHDQWARFGLVLRDYLDEEGRAR